MNRARTLAVVGVSDQEIAHLRLLLRKVAPDLHQRWQWGDENGADLVIVDTASFAGQMARTRVLAAGVRCAVFSDQPDAGDLVLHRPLLRRNVTEVLNTAAGAQVREAEVGANTADFYTRDLGDDAYASSASTSPNATPAVGLDELLSAQPLELRADYEWAAPPPAPAPATTASPSPMQGDAQQRPHQPGDADASRRYATRAAMLADTTPHDLRAYLEHDLLRMPARFALPEAPPLVLDPKHELVHTPGGLAALEPYCRARWRPVDWQPLTSAELVEIRAMQPGRPYAHLLWLHALLHSDGVLARHLDPGGTYRLKHWIEIDHALGRYFRIASALLQPSRLHEVAAAANAPMADVFDLVNAYAAVGLIEWQPRPPRRDDPARSPTSLLKKLRNPFGKS